MRRFFRNIKDRRLSIAQKVTEAEETRNEAVATAKIVTVDLPAIFKGLLLSFLSGVSYTLCAVIVKSMKNIHPGQLATYSFLTMCTFSLPQAVKTQENLLGPRELRGLLLLRGICGAANVFLYYTAFRYLSLGEAAVIISSCPVFVTVAAKILLKESCGIVQFITAITTVVGIMFITMQPEMLTGKSVNYTKEYIYGLVAAFATLIVSTLRFILMRKINSVHHSIIMFNLGWVATLLTTILTFSVGHFSLPRCGLQQGLLILTSILSYVGTLLLTMALQYESAGPVSTVRSASDVILSFLWQTCIFLNSPDAFSIAGAVLVVFSIALVGITKWLSSLPSGSAPAKRLKFLLA